MEGKQDMEIDELWRLHNQEIRQFLLRRCSDQDLADDLLAETFLQAGQAIRLDRDISAGWLFTVARRRLIDHWRQTGRQQDALRRHVREPRVDEDPALLIDASHASVALNSALSRLCPTQRTALILRYCSDLNVTSVAHVLDLSYSATESLLARGRRKLATEYVVAERELVEV